MVSINITDQNNLNCVDIKKDAISANLKQIYNARDDLVLGNKCSDSPNLDIIKKAITNSYEKLFPIINNGNKNSKININIQYFFFDAGWSDKVIDRYLCLDSTTIYKCQTPATYSDPGPRPFATNSININHTFNLKDIALNAKVTYESSGIFTLNKSTSKIKIIIDPINKNPFNKIDCFLNYKHDIVSFNPGSNRLSKLFKGNNQKSKYINENLSKYNTDIYIKNRNAYVICKEIGDTMQALCLKYILNNTKNNDDYKDLSDNNCALLTNDAVLAARSLTFAIPFIVLNAAAGLVKYYFPGNIESVNASFFETYISNALQSNDDQLNLLDEWRTKYLNRKIIKIKGSDDKYWFNQKLNTLFDKFFTCINNCNKILKILNSNFKKIDFSDDENLKKLKIFTSLLSVQKMIFKVNSKFIINNKFKEFLNKSLLNILNSDNKIKIYNDIPKQPIGLFSQIKKKILDYIYKPPPPITQYTSEIIALDDFITNLLQDYPILEFYNNLKENEFKVNNDLTLSQFIIRYCKEEDKVSGGKKFKSQKKKYKKYNKKSKKYKKSKQNKKKYKFIKKSKKKYKKYNKKSKKIRAGAKRNFSEYKRDQPPQESPDDPVWAKTNFSEYEHDQSPQESPDDPAWAKTNFSEYKRDQPPQESPDDPAGAKRKYIKTDNHSPISESQNIVDTSPPIIEYYDDDDPSYYEPTIGDQDESIYYYQNTEFTHFIDDEDVLTIYSIIYPFIYINPYIYYYLIKYEDNLINFIDKIYNDHDLKFIYDLIIQNKIDDSIIEITDDILTNKYKNDENIDQLLTYKFQLKIYEILNK